MTDIGIAASAVSPADPSRKHQAANAHGAHFWVLAALLALLLLTGGGSRADIESLVLLRPLTFVALAYGIAVADWHRLAQLRVPLLLLAALALLVGLQLIPLPPVVWESLPGRGIYRDIYAAAGLDAPWLPITTAPGRGLNSFLSLSAPFAVLLLFSSIGAKHRRDLYLLIWIGALASVFLGIAQLAGSPQGPLYLYRITNTGLPVGFLANRNHQGLLVAVGILVSGYLAASTLVGRQRTSPLILTGALGATMVFLLFLLVLGSRAGLLLGVAMLLPAGFMIYRAQQQRQKPGSGPLWRDRRARWAIVITCVGVGLIFSGAYFFSRSLAFDRLIGKEFGEDVRAAVNPITFDLIKRFLPLGSGFGSFESQFMQAEPLALLSPSYMNHAHNDWFEVVLEGGIAALAILAAFLMWYGRALFRLIRARPLQFDFEGFVGAIIILAYGAASVVDYPLRVPVMMAVFAIGCGHLAVGRRTM